MTAREFLHLGASGVSTWLFGMNQHAPSEPRHSPLVRVAELEIDPAQLEAYRAALKEEIETSIRVEPGVFALYAVADKDRPSQIRVFEVYADEAAYRAHLETPHFKKYKTSTQGMVKKLKLIETDPIILGAKPR